MINTIKIKDVACYHEMATLDTDKHVNLIYGLNGSGKSTLSEFMRNSLDSRYSGCSIEPTINNDEEEILVYNEHYVEEIFYASTKQPGIFSLSKENKAAKEAIEQAMELQKEFQSQIKKEQEALQTTQEAWNKEHQNYVDRIWQVQQDYTGGDRLLDYCFTGVRRPKELLFKHVCDFPKPTETPTYTIDSLKQQVRLLNAASGNTITELQELVSTVSEIESDSIFKQIITGNSGSYVADLINKLHNSDWVKEGLEFQTEGICPFCQRPYDSLNIIEDLKAFFDKAYEEALQKLQTIYDDYSTYTNSLRPNAAFDDIEIIQVLKQEYHQAYSAYVSKLKDNIRIIADKIKNPSQESQLFPTDNLLQNLNAVIAHANQIIKDFNQKILTKDAELANIKKLFWEYIRVHYDQTIIDYANAKKVFDSKEKKHKDNIESLKNQIQQQKVIIVTQQKNIVNIEDAITHINSMLQDIGIDDISIQKVDEEEMYAIGRHEETEVKFKTLSEGERTIISVLYFIETCKGLINRGATRKKRIVVIDDPVSSLSTQYLFSLGRIISGTFYPEVKFDQETEQFKITPKIEQLFILTHSLYFMYEMTEMKKEQRHAYQKLFRISKSANGSQIAEMHYEHNQSDYHSYWMAVKDRTNPVLWANSMRNIIEYFFGFVEKKDLNAVFQKLTETRYQAFNRFINRESHSFGQNIYDFKDFDYDIFFEAFKKVFDESGYQAHFKKMMKIG